jgi:hypothetical protein
MNGHVTKPFEPALQFAVLAARAKLEDVGKLGIYP